MYAWVQFYKLIWIILYQNKEKPVFKAVKMFFDIVPTLLHSLPPFIFSLTDMVIDWIILKPFVTNITEVNAD